MKPRDCINLSISCADRILSSEILSTSDQPSFTINSGEWCRIHVILHPYAAAPSSPFIHRSATGMRSRHHVLQDSISQVRPLLKKARVVATSAAISSSRGVIVLRSTATRGSAAPAQDDGAAARPRAGRAPRLAVPRILLERPHVRDRVLQHLMAGSDPGRRPVDQRRGRCRSVRV